MNILFIAGQSIRSNSSVTMMNLAYINGLVDDGNNVKVVTASLPENHISRDDGFNLGSEVEIEEYSVSATFNALSNKKEKSDNILKTNIKNILRKLYYSFSIYDSQKGWVNNAEKIEYKNYYDLIISSSDPKHSHLFAKKLIDLGKVKYGKWIQIWGDPMYLDITRKSIFFNKRLYKEEEYLISSADKILYVSPFTAEKQKQLFPRYKDKIDYVLIPYYSLDESEPNKLNGNDMIFSYFGDYNSHIRNLEPLYNAALETNINLLIRGNSDKPLPSKKNIDVHRRISIQKLKELENKTDVFIHLCNSHGTQIPAKLYYYSGTKKPILFILDGDVERIEQFYRPFNRYIFCKNNKEEIKSEINKIRSGYYSNTEIKVPEELAPVYIARNIISKVNCQNTV